MQIGGTILIFAVLIASYYYFVKKEKALDKKENVLKGNFYKQLDKVSTREYNTKVVLAGGDDNNENPVAEVIKRISMPDDVGIKKYE